MVHPARNVRLCRVGAVDVQVVGQARNVPAVGLRVPPEEGLLVELLALVREEEGALVDGHLGEEAVALAGGGPHLDRRRLVERRAPLLVAQPRARHSRRADGARRADRRRERRRVEDAARRADGEAAADEAGADLQAELPRGAARAHLLDQRRRRRLALEQRGRADEADEDVAAAARRRPARVRQTAVVREELARARLDEAVAAEVGEDGAAALEGAELAQLQVERDAAAVVVDVHPQALLAGLAIEAEKEGVVEPELTIRLVEAKLVDEERPDRRAHLLVEPIEQLGAVGHQHVRRAHVVGHRAHRRVSRRRVAPAAVRRRLRLRRRDHPLALVGRADPRHPRLHVGRQLAVRRRRRQLARRRRVLQRLELVARQRLERLALLQRLRLAQVLSRGVKAALRAQHVGERDPRISDGRRELHGAVQREPRAREPALAVQQLAELRPARGLGRRGRHVCAATERLAVRRELALRRDGGA